MCRIVNGAVLVVHELNLSFICVCVQPRQALEGANLGEAADVYSYGVILWELWTRQSPFAGMTQVQAAMSGACVMA